ncbi:uncharacterized protein [Typha angustifolia]|uniref:uncharacterized protein n=1 Tax=Typha angustifolia TaxID=59011 RepID=UPI003C2EC2D9
MSQKKLKVNLLIHEASKKVVFAESDKEFVDTLFSFLALPIGKIIGLLGDNHNSLGSMLLWPQTALEERCGALKLSIGKPLPRRIFPAHLMVLKLLKISLVSMMPLTDVFVKRHSGRHLPITERCLICKRELELLAAEAVRTTKSGSINITLLRNKTKNEVVYAEAGEDLVDLIFSFLTFPLGSIIKLLNGQSSIGCIDNLYKTVNELNTHADGIISENCKAVLLAPKLAAHFSLEKSLLSVEEDPPIVRTTFFWGDSCRYSIWPTVNPDPENLVCLAEN